MTQVLLIGVLAASSWSTTPEPEPALGLEGPLALVVEPARSVTLLCPAASLFQLEGATPALRIWWRTYGHGPLTAERQLLLEPQTQGAPLLTSPPGEDGALVLEAGSARAEHLILLRLDSGVAAARSGNWSRLDAELLAWTEDPAHALLPTPAWASSDLEATFTELAVVAEVLLRTEVAPEERTALLRAAAQRGTERWRPLASPPYIAQPLPLGRGAVVIDDPDEPFYAVEDGAGRELAMPATGVLRLELLQTHQGECTRAELTTGTWPIAAMATDCAPGEGGAASMVLQRPLAVGAPIRLSVAAGSVLVRARLFTRQPSWRSWLEPDLLPQLGRRPAGAPSSLVRAEALRLLDDRSAAADAYTELAVLAREAWLRAYAAWRSLALRPDAGRATQELVGLIAGMSAAVADADVLGQLAAVDAARQSLLADVPASTRALALGDRLALAPALAERILSRAWAPGSRSLGLGLASLAWAKAPQRADLGRDLVRAATTSGRSLSLPFDGVEPTYLLEPTPATPPMTPPTELPARLATVAVLGDTLEIPADPLGLDRLRRVPLALVPAADGPAFATLTVDDLPLVVPLDQPVVRTSVALTPGPHRLSAASGATLLAPTLRGAPGPGYELRRYWRLEERPLVAPLPSEPVPTLATVSIRLAPAEAVAADVPVELEVCVDDDCHAARIWPGAGVAVSDPLQASAPATLTVDVPAAAESLRLRRSGPGPRIWVRVALRARATTAETSTSLDWRPTASPLELPARLAELNAALAREPANANLHLERARLALVTSDFLTARADLGVAAWSRPEAATLLAALGEPGTWVQSPPATPTQPRAPAVRLHAEHALSASPEAVAALTPAVLAFRRDEVTAGLRELETLALRDGATADLARALLAERLATTEPARAAELLAGLATRAPDAAALLRAEAARLRLAAADEAQWRLAYAEAVTAGSAPGALAVRGAVSLQSTWQPIPFVDSSAGQAWLSPTKPAGPAASETPATPAAPDLTAPLSSRVHLAAPQRPVRVGLLGPTVLRVASRARFVRDVTTSLRVLIDGQPVQTLTIAPLPDETLTLTKGLDGPVTQPAVALVPILEPGPHEAELAPESGLATLALAVRAHEPEKPVTPLLPGAPIVLPAPPPAATLARPPLLPVTAPGLDDLRALTPPLPLLPWTSVAAVGVENRNRDDEADHALNEPMLPVSLSAHRRFADRVWATFGPETTLRPAAAATWAMTGRLDVGEGPGLRLAVAAETRGQDLHDGWQWSRRLTAEAGWELALLPGLELRALAGLFGRQLSADSLPREHRAVDPLVFSTYAADHLTGGTLYALVSLRPATDLLAQAFVRGVTNPGFATLDGVRSGLALWAVASPIYLRLGYEHDYRLADSHRFVAYDRDRLSARVGLAHWLAAGHRARMELAQRYSIEDRRYEVGLAVTYELSGGRGMSDFAPTMPFRQQWADLEPQPFGMAP